MYNWSNEWLIESNCCCVASTNVLECLNKCFVIVVCRHIEQTALLASKATTIWCCCQMSASGVISTTICLTTGSLTLAKMWLLTAQLCDGNYRFCQPPDIVWWRVFPWGTRWRRQKGEAREVSDWRLADLGCTDRLLHGISATTLVNRSLILGLFVPGGPVSTSLQTYQPAWGRLWFQAHERDAEVVQEQTCGSLCLPCHE